MPKKVVALSEQDPLTLDVEGPTVAMTRRGEGYPPPHTAEVHVDEVENWAKHGWVLAKHKPVKDAGEGQAGAD